MAILICVCAGAPLAAEEQKPRIPDPVKFLNTFNVVANVVYSVLEDMGYRIELEDRQAGIIRTRPYEFITGSLTSSEVDKVAIKRDTITGAWLKAQYTVEALIERVSSTETMVTITTRMEALNRDVDGAEKWIPVESRGTYERRILGRISHKLLGNDNPVQEEKKGFWGKRPQPVDPRQPRFPSPR